MISSAAVVCSAGSRENTLSQVYVWNEYIDVFVNGSFIPENLSVKISNQTAPVADSGSLKEKNILVRTTVLLDISASIPEVSRDKVVSFLDKLIAGLSGNEEVRIGVFGEEITILQDFTSDRYDLDKAADEVQFNDQKSRIYDAVYNTIPSLTPVDDEPCYYRTIVISDGVDHTDIGITKEELFIKLQTETYPIDVVSVSETEQSEQEKELSALMRISGGRYVNIHPDADVSSLLTILAVDNVFWIRAEIPGALLDGSMRQVDISDGYSNIQFDKKIPIYTVSGSDETDVPVINTPIEDSDKNPEVLDRDEEDEEAEDEPQKSSIMTAFGEHTPIILTIIGALLLIIIATVIILLVSHFSKKKRETPAVPIQSAYPREENDYDKTVNVFDSGATEITGDIYNPPGARVIVKLSSPNNPGQSWMLTVSGELKIGRSDHCEIRFEDKSVSHEQCKIVEWNGGLAVVHLSRTNKTLLNGANVESSAPIKMGDMLRFGREALQIDFIQSQQPEYNQYNQNAMHGGDIDTTASIF